MKSKISIDMTRGPLLGKILLFSLPLMASNILQLLFNAADVVIVGRFAGHASLAAVGSTTSVISLFTTLLVGLSVGVNVLIARYIGVGKCQKEISLALHTAIALALISGVLLGVSGILAAEWMLNVIAVPEDVYGLALLYVRLYFLGTPAVMLYNYGAAALRATGDTRRPLLFLLVSGVVNVVLNMCFVIIWQMDVAGVALATVISHYLSAALVLLCLCRAQDVPLSWRKLCLDRQSLVQMARVGIPAGVQNCLFSLSNVAIQSAINSYSSEIIAGCSAAASIESFLYVSMNAFHHACQTFASQNMGAGRHERIGPAVRICLLCTVILGLCQSTIVALFSHRLVSIYNQDPAVIQAGAERLMLVGTLYVIYGVADVLIGAIRGCGVPVAPVVINLLGTCVFRFVWVALLDTSVMGVEWVNLSYPASWLVITIALTVFWCRMRRKIAGQV
ncbi:MAG: MATE family efflux transporter [Stomatobaculum sp.]